MKTYILTVSVKIDDQDIEKAHEWEKRKGLDYKDDIAHLVFDCISDGGNIDYEIQTTELDQEKE